MVLCRENVPLVVDALSICSDFFEQCQFYVEFFQFGWIVAFTLRTADESDLHTG